MMVEPPRPQPQVVRDIDVLWVSNLRALKRPELVLELARQLPHVRFTLAGGPMPGGQTYYDDVAAAAARLPNLTMLGPVRYRDSGELFDRAKIFLNTSSIEGFPNTFLQAWIRGVPVVTLFGPTHVAWSETSYDKSLHLQLDVECGPCQQRECPLKHHDCMRRLSPDQVYHAAVQLLAKHRAPPSVAS